MPVKAVPEGFGTVTPFLVSSDPDRLLEFLRSAFGAEEVEVHRDETGRVMHAQARIVDSIIMIGGEHPMCPVEKTSLYLYLEDVDSIYRSAVSAGAESIMEPEDQFYGDRMGGVKDPTGNTWWLAKHIEDVTQEQMEQRMKERAAAAAAAGSGA